MLAALSASVGAASANDAPGADAPDAALQAAPPGPPSLRRGWQADRAASEAAWRRRLAKVQFTGAAVTLGTPAAAGPYHASLAYVGLTLAVAPEKFGFPAAPKVRLVPATFTDATNNACETQALDLNKVAGPYGRVDANWTGVNLTVDSSDSSATASETAKFYMGGRFKVCYSDTGDWGSVEHAGVVAQEVVVNGVYDGCTTPNCLANKEYYCYVAKKKSNAAGSCVLSWDGAGRGVEGNVGKGSWTPAFPAPTYSAAGVVTTASSGRPCATAGDAAEARYIGVDADGADRYITPASNKITMPQTYSTLAGDTLVAFTVAACYCPDLGGCDAHSEFTQQIGKVYYFVSRICVDKACTPDFTGAVRKVPFALRVDCPPGACSAGNGSRVKFVTPAAANDLPKWDDSNGCRGAVHLATIGPLGNCENATECSFPGGARQDYKFFTGNESGASFGAFTWLSDLANVSYGAERYDLRHTSGSAVVDVCFCESDCTSAPSWFKVGSFRLSPLKLVGHSLLGEPANDIKAVEYANVPGIIGLSRPSAEEGSLGFADGGVLKVLSDDAVDANDVACRQRSYDSSLIAAGPSNGVTAKAFAGSSTGATDTEKLIFDGGLRANQISIRRAGVVAICYCQSATTAGCVSDTQWALIGRLTVKGPRIGQHWDLSTNVPTFIEYFGFGLESTNVLRFLDAGASCLDNGGNPRRQDSVVNVGCPSNCQPLSNTAGSETNVVTKIVASDAVGCDTQHANCGSSTLTAIDTTSKAHATTIQGSRSVLTFSADPGLDDGDTIALGAEVTGGTTEELATMRGVFPFADQDTYTIGLRVQREGTATFSVPVGWPTGSTPSFSVTAGTWKRHNRATTNEEIMSREERLGLKVCWSASTTSGYVSEAGTVSFVAPPSMPVAVVNPVTTVVGQAVPTVVSFTTGAKDAYSDATMGVTELRLLFTTSESLEVTLAAGTAIEAADTVAKSAATRVVCGTLFEELWSSDANGFPMPTGCSYGPARTLNAVTSREISLVFESGAGLAASTRHQIVVKATTKQAAREGDEVVHILAVASRGGVGRGPVAVELGRGRLGVRPSSSSSATSPQLASIALAGSGNVPLADPLAVVLTGDATRKVTAGANLRFVFRPLTAWGFGASCVASCEPTSGATCGAPQRCTSAAVVGGEGNNVAHVVLSSTLTPVDGTVTPTIKLWGLSSPPQGFFPTRLGVQLTDANDVYPQYLESTATLSHTPASGFAAATGSLLSTDGNSAPFQGASNVLYARLVFGVTLKSVAADDDAYLKVTLPTGYTCVAAGADAALAFFGFSALPRRGGSLAGSASGAWTFASNVCEYKLKQHAAIYAGAVAVVKLTVTSPATALSATAAANAWSITVASKGHAAAAVEMPASTFSSPSAGPLADTTAANVAVLGLLSDLVGQPSDFTVSAEQQVRIFFKAAQSAGLGSRVKVDAPPGFDFGGRSCTVRDLPEYVYGGVLSAARTSRLPDLAGCVADGPSSAGVYGPARIFLVGEITAGTRYGFEIVAKNPGGAGVSSATLMGWRVTVVTSAGHPVDGSNQVLRLNAKEAPAAGWAPYRVRMAAATHIAIQVSSYLPFSLASAAATATVFPIKVSADVNAKMRIIAPSGHLWDITGAKFAREAAGDTGVPGTSADLPGGAPTVTQSDSALEWAAAAYATQETYGFICQVKVPDLSPVDATNAFFVEIGDWASGNIADRHEAAVVPAGEVRGLGNAEVLPSRQVADATGPVVLQLYIVTPIPAAGALRITSPANFRVPASCSVVVLQGAAPTGVTCSASTSASAESVVELKAGGGGTLSRGLYRFRLESLTNTAAATNAASGTTQCGTEQCWKFESLQDGNSLDMLTYAKGFAVLAKMPRAVLVNLTEAQRVAIGRTDRPGHESRLVFAVEVGQAVAAASDLVVRGPPGTTFRADCLSGIKVASADVFGSSALWDSGTYTAWPASAAATACRGDGNTATITIGSGFATGRLYPWQMQIAATPLVQPQDIENVWTFVLGTEASEPVPSFPLAMFDDASVTPHSLAQAAETPLIVDFAPRSEVQGDTGGRVVLRAPQWFRFIASPGGASSGCDIEMFELSAAGAVVRPLLSTIRCFVAQDTPFALTVELLAGAVLSKGTKYRLITYVRNPTELLNAQVWMLQSFRNLSTTIASALDEVRVPGYGVIAKATLWSVGFAASASSGDEQPPNRGMENVMLQIWAQTPAALQQGDVLEIVGPSTFSFAATASGSAAGACLEYSWDTNAPSRGPPLASTLATTVTCPGAGRVRIAYTGAAAVAGGARLAMLIKTRNPRVTPTVSDNFWRFTHVRGGATLVAGLAEGYSILPQLENPLAELLGPALAAGSLSAIKIGFKLVSNCTLLRLTALAPQGFVLSAATLRSALASLPGAAVANQTVDRAAAVTLEDLTGLAPAADPPPDDMLQQPASEAVAWIALTATVGQTVALELSGVRLAEGGETKWRVETFAGGVSLDRRDFAGFRQPGVVTVIGQQLRSELTPSLSPLNRTPAELQVMAEWQPRVRSPALAELTLRCSSAIQASEVLVISTDTDYQLQAENFELFAISSTGTKAMVRVSAAAGASPASLRVTLLQDVRAQADLYVVMPLVTASRPSPRGFWSFSTTSGGALPTQTNDNQQPGFDLAEILGFRVSATHAPPTATFLVDFQVELGGAVAADLRILLPASYSAPLNCTASSANFCEVRGSITSGQKSIYLLPRGAASFARNLTLTALITAPIADPISSRAWLIEAASAVDLSQVGWGEDRQGMSLTPMGGVKVEYAGVPLTTVTLAIGVTIRKMPGSTTMPRLLRILPPATYELSCDARFLRLLSLPGNKSVCSVDPFSLGLAGDLPFPEGRQMFTLGVTVPRTTPGSSTTSEGFFKVLLLEGDVSSGSLRVADSNMEVPAQEVQTLLLRAQQPALAWTFSRPLSEPFITISIKFDRTLPEGWEPLRMAALLVEFPQGFQHVIAGPSDVRNLNPEFPHPEEWAEYDDATNNDNDTSIFGGGVSRDLRKLRILRDEAQRVPAGVYKWSFPVSIPLVLPTENLWRLSLCRSPACGSTDDPTGASGILVAFPIPGFVHGEVSGEAAFDPGDAGAAVRVAGPGVLRALVAAAGPRLAAAAAAFGLWCLYA